MILSNIPEAVADWAAEVIGLCLIVRLASLGLWIEAVVVLILVGLSIDARVQYQRMYKIAERFARRGMGDVGDKHERKAER